MKKKLEEIKQNLKELVVQDVEQFFKRYGEYIVPTNIMINDILSIKGRYYKIVKDQIRGVLSTQERTREINDISSSLLNLIDQLDDTAYISNLSDEDIQQNLVQVNSRLVNSQEQIEELKQQNKKLEDQVIELCLMILENRIISFDTQDANLETYNITRYLRISQENSYWFQLKIDSILNAIVKYSEKYPELPDHEKNELIETLNQLDLSLVNQKKVQRILENFGLRVKN